jgi:two-component system sensor histidine kinase SenX3
VAVAVAIALLVVAAGWALVLRRRLAEISDELELARAAGTRAENESGARLDQARSDLRRLSNALDAVPQGVVVCDAEGREVLRNTVASAYADTRLSEALVEQAIQEELREARHGTPQRRSLDLFGPPRRQLVISAAPLEVGGAVAVVDDVSERRRLEAMRRDFVANISHELKTPVGALGVLSEAIVSEDDRDVVHRLAERMTGEAIRVGRIIDDLLALTRIEGEGEDTTAYEDVRVADVVEDATQRVLPLADQRRITIDTSDVGSRHVVHGDARQLVSAVANLLENACKYSDEGAAVFVRSTRDGDAVTIDVEDRGIGIPSKDLDRVFERFYRVDAARSRATGGTGLGLSIVRHVAANHGGSVTVQSAEGVGSTFTLRLPAADA